jgi:hypothetical protein
MVVRHVLAGTGRQSGPAVVNMFVIAAGGASAAGNGGNSTAAAGGGGAILEQVFSINTGQTYTIQAGNGGPGIAGDLAAGRLGSAGGYSRFGTFYVSGGYAGAYGAAGASGVVGSTAAGGGNAGGGTNGGGGGAGAAASTINGGIGIQSILYNELYGGTIYWGGGGAGATTTGGGGTSGTRGLTGGGLFPAGNGTYGGGGAPNDWNLGIGGGGGGGMVIVRLNPAITVSSTTGSPTVTNKNGYNYYAWIGNNNSATVVTGSITF